MEVVQQQFLAFILFTWQLINFRMQALFDESLEAERTRTRAAEKKQKSLELIQDATDKSRLLTRQRRRRIRVRKKLFTCVTMYFKRAVANKLIVLLVSHRFSTTA